MCTAHSAQIWRIFLPVYHRPSKMPGFLIWFYAILGRIVVPEMRFPGISLGKFLLALEIAVVTRCQRAMFRDFSKIRIFLKLMR